MGCSWYGCTSHLDLAWYDCSAKRVQAWQLPWDFGTPIDHDWPDELWALVRKDQIWFEFDTDPFGCVVIKTPRGLLNAFRGDFIVLDSYRGVFPVPRALFFSTHQLYVDKYARKA
jgi:hypothetical protein